MDHPTPVYHDFALLKDTSTQVLTFLAICFFLRKRLLKIFFLYFYGKNQSLSWPYPKPDNHDLNIFKSKLLEEASTQVSIFMLNNIKKYSIILNHLL